MTLPMLFGYFAQRIDGRVSQKSTVGVWWFPDWSGKRRRGDRHQTADLGDGRNNFA